MAGLYIHIPFCKSRCIYCGFYSTTRADLQQRYVDAICSLTPDPSPNGEGGSLTPDPSPKGEGGRDYGAVANSSFFTLHSSFKIETIYLGGGTPSQLTGDQLRQLFLYINKVYGMENVKEVTMECNPDDITVQYAEMLSQLPINRISMGVQTFNNERLRFLHRRHTAEQIPLAVERLRNIGIRNISIDLMYGFPGETLDDWHRDIDEALRLDVEHLSAYCLMYEEGTPLYQLKMENERLKKMDPRLIPIDEETELQMYSDLIDRLTAAGYEHYEISNFAKIIQPKGSPSDLSSKPEGSPCARKSFRSLHNSSYWNQTPYIGLGAAAHSYNGHDCRRWNIDNIEKFIEGIEQGKPVYEEEILDDDTRYNDIVMTALRTCEGLNLTLLSEEQRAYCLEQARQFMVGNEKSPLLERNGDYLKLTRQGLFVSNMVMSELMKV